MVLCIDCKIRKKRVTDNEGDRLSMNWQYSVDCGDDNDDDIDDIDDGPQ